MARTLVRAQEKTDTKTTFKAVTGRGWGDADLTERLIDLLRQGLLLHRMTRSTTDTLGVGTRRAIPALKHTQCSTRQRESQPASSAVLLR